MSDQIPPGSRELAQAILDVLALTDQSTYFKSAAFHAWVHIKAAHLAQEAELLARCFQETEALRADLVKRIKKDPPSPFFMKKCDCLCHNSPDGLTVNHVVACCNARGYEVSELQ